MRNTELCEIDAEVIIYEPVKVRLREVISSIAFTLIGMVFAYGFTDYALVVSHRIIDYVAAIIACIALILGIYISVTNIKDYINDRRM